MKDKRSCSKCSYTGDNVVRCPECGSWMRKAQGIRRLGWVLLFLGLFLVAMMGTITVLLAPTMLSAGSAGARFTGTPEQGILVLGLFGLVIIFGFMSSVSGVWQIATGRRNIWIVILMVGLTLLLIVAASAVRTALDHKNDRVVPGIWLSMESDTIPNLSFSDSQRGFSPLASRWWMMRKPFKRFQADEPNAHRAKATV